MALVLAFVACAMLVVMDGAGLELYAVCCLLFGPAVGRTGYEVRKHPAPSYVQGLSLGACSVVWLLLLGPPRDWRPRLFCHACLPGCSCSLVGV